MTTFTHRRAFRIQWADCDPAGIVFNPRFFEFFDTNTWMMFEAALGVKAQEINRRFGLAGMVLVDVQADFMRPAAFGEEVALASRVAEFRRSSFDVDHTLMKGDDVLVKGRETRVWAVPHKSEPGRMVASAIPAEVLAKFG